MPILQPESCNPPPETLADWLVHLERVHPSSIEMGLERVSRVRAAMGLDTVFPLIAVGGTNGKGSVCAMLESILSEAGYRLGCMGERRRIASVASPYDIVVDLFAGIGYFSLPIAVYSKPQKVFACEINPIAFD